MAEEKKDDKKKNVFSKEKLTTAPGRLSFPHVYQVNTGNIKKGKFTAGLFVSKEKDASWKPFMAEGLKVCREAFGQDVQFKDLKNPIKDGDAKYNEVLKEKGEDEAKKFAHLKGCRYIETSTGEKNKPHVFKLIDGKPVPLLEAEYKVKGGDFAMLSVTVASWEMVREVVIVENGKERTEKRPARGFTLYLNNVLFLKSGPALGEARDPSSDFKAIDIGELEEFAEGEPLSDELFGEAGSPGTATTSTSGGLVDEELNF